MTSMLHQLSCLRSSWSQVAAGLLQNTNTREFCFSAKWLFPRRAQKPPQLNAVKLDLRLPGKTSAEHLLRESCTSGSCENAEYPSDVTESMEKWKNYNNWVRSQARYCYRPKMNPQDTSIVLFPGQGSQTVGMGSNLLEYPNVTKMFEKASDIIGYDLLEICLKGPQEKLDKTIFCQPALLVTSLAAVEKLRHQSPWAIENCIAAAGFSIGEYAALVFAGVMSFEDALRVVKVRAQAMQEASEETPSGMMTAFLHANSRIKFALHTAKRYCSEHLDIKGPVCQIASFLYPGCKVIAGHAEALDFIEMNKQDFGIRRLKRLPVSGAFHTPLMKSAKPVLERAFSRVVLHKPIIPVHSNVSGAIHHNAKTVQHLLPQQIIKPVKWEQTLHILYSRKQGDLFPQTYEVGPGQQMGALLKLTNLKAHEAYRHISV